jgi:hypothetical protein
MTREYRRVFPAQFDRRVVEMVRGCVEVKEDTRDANDDADEVDATSRVSRPPEVNAATRCVTVTRQSSR